MNSVGTVAVGLRKIDEMLLETEAEMDAMGAETVVDRLYSQRSTPEFTQLKEQWELGLFVHEHNKTHTPTLVWAGRNQRGTDHADFSVYAADKSYLWDVEVTALFSNPTRKNPQAYEDFSPYPIWQDPADSRVTHVDIDEPRKSQPYATLTRVLETHLRNVYPPYWLVIYDNEHGVQHPNLKPLANLIRGILKEKIRRGRLPSNLREVWVFDFSGVVKAWP